ncbi:MAG: ABC transporter permease [Chloroflexota bacterium]
MAARRAIDRAQALRLAALVAVLLGWEVLSQSGLGLRELLPSLRDIGHALASDLGSRTFWMHVGTSAYEVGLGFALGALAGLVVGLIVGSSRFWRGVLEPVLVNFFALPIIVLYPLLILSFGLGVGSKVAMAALSAFFPIAITTIAAFYRVRPIFLHVARVYGLTPMQTYTRVILPAIAGPVLAGLRLGFGTALVGALLAETKQSRGGLGFAAMEHYQRLQMADMYAALVFIFCVSGALNWVFERATARLVRERQTGELLATV